MTIKRPSGPQRKLSSEDYSSAEILLEAAAFLMTPADQGQRAAFERLMPHLYVLKEKGCSIAQITNLLNQSGFKLQPSTVRVYYRELLAKHIEQCKAHMSEQMPLLAEIRQQANSKNLGAMRSRFEQMIVKQQAQATSRLESVLKLDMKRAVPAFSSAQPPLPSPVRDVQPALVPSVNDKNPRFGAAPHGQIKPEGKRADDAISVAPAIGTDVKNKAASPEEAAPCENSTSTLR